MLKKLSSVLKNPILQLTFKAGFLTLLLYFADRYRLLAIFFIPAAFYFYFSGNRASQLLISFLSLFIASLIIVSQLTDYPVARLLASLVFGFLFFLLLGIKNLIFIHRDKYYHFLNNFLFFLVFLIFFLTDKSSFFWLQLLTVFLISFLLLRELLNYQSPLILSKINLLSVGLAVLISQFFWAVSLLPIGFLNQTAAMLLIVLIAKDLLENYLIGSLSRTAVLRNITVFLIFNLIIFIASKWTP